MHGTCGSQARGSAASAANGNGNKAGRWLWCLFACEPFQKEAPATGELQSDSGATISLSDVARSKVLPGGLLVACDRSKLAAGVDWHAFSVHCNKKQAILRDGII